MWVGCYVLDLYCENKKKYPDGIHEHDEFPHTYTSEKGSKARAKARKAGWIVRLNKTALCPKCSGKVKNTS
jgi:hypothetical protein